MKRHNYSSTPALAAFAVTVLLAVAASATTLLPAQTAEVADSQVHLQIDQLIPPGVLD